MKAYLVKNVTRFQKNIIVDGKFLSSFKIGSKLTCLGHEFLVKGIVLGDNASKQPNTQSILLEPVITLEDETIFIDQTLELVI